MKLKLFIYKMLIELYYGNRWDYNKFGEIKINFYPENASQTVENFEKLGK